MQDTDLRPTVNLGLRHLGDECEPLFYGAWREGYEEVDPVHLHPVKSTKALDKFVSRFRRRDLQQVGRAVSIAVGISSRDGLLENGKTSKHVFPGFEAARTLLGTKLERALDGAKKLGRLEALSSAGVDKVIITLDENHEVIVPLGNEDEMLTTVSSPRLLKGTFEPVE